MDTDFLEPATRAVLAMTAALLLHHSDEFSRKLQRKFRKSPTLSQQPNLLPVPRSAEQIQELEPGSDASICTVSDASSILAQAPAIVYSTLEEHPSAYESYELPTLDRPPLTETLHGGYAQVPNVVVGQHAAGPGWTGGYPRDFETPKRPPLRGPIVMVDSPAPIYRGRYLYTPPQPELEESFQLRRRPVPPRRQVMRDVGPLDTSYTAPAPFIRTPTAAVSRTPQKRVFQRQVASESPVIVSSTVQRGVVPQSRFFPSEPSPILASPRSPTGSMLIRTPQGIRVMTPQEEQSFRLARMPAGQVRARLVRGAQVTPQSPRTSPYSIPQTSVLPPESPESIQMARAADRYHVRSRIARRPPTTPTSRPGPYAIPDSAKADSPFKIARPAGGYRRHQQESLMDSSLPSFAGFPLAEASRAQGYYSAIASTPISRQGIGFPDLSQLPPTPINVTQDSLLGPNSPQTPTQRVPIPAGSPYARSRPQPQQSYIAPTPTSLHSPSHIRSPIRPPGWDAATARHLMSSAIRDKTASPQQSRQENLLEDEEMDFAPDMNSTIRDAAETVAGAGQGDDIRDALWTLYSRINRQVAIIQAGDKPGEEERVGIFRRSSADYDVEEGRMRD
ncbi:hypothetical protein pipiens_002504 [Culex pipiens pipiens]|uniref:Uncharacterized protein n=1 Tax=Culex pipiens pipiens TaxID=38569 RepID=A0ABD1DCY7_CULPP